MRITGVTIAYQAVSHGYPVAESILSMLPLCDEVIANIGQSDDGTREAILEVNSPKIRLIQDAWDLSLRRHGLLLSHETNRAMDCSTGDWIVYLQADEVLHEQDRDELAALMSSLAANRKVDGISLKYIHFYGSPWYFQDHYFRWYTRAVRVVRKDPAIRSVGDALKFRRFIKGSHPRRLRTVKSRAQVYHYGWARPPEVMLKKQKHMQRFWHSDETLRERYAGLAAEQIYDDLGHLRKFTGTHPKVMQERIKAATWPFDPRLSHQMPHWLRLGSVFLWYPLAHAYQKLTRRRWQAN